MFLPFFKSFSPDAAAEMMHSVVKNMGISNIPDAVVVMDPPLQKAFEAKGFKSVAESKTISNLVKQIVGEIVDE